MKNIFKLLLASFLIPLLFTSCDNEDYNDWTKPDPSFRLFDTTLGASVLYSTMENNPFVLTWDKPANASGDYSVVISATEDFASKVLLGTTTTSAFKTTIGVLNTAMLQAGLNPYAPQIAFVRVENGTQVSNAISFTVTPYPVAKPIITSPTTGSAFVLNPALATDVVSAVTWNDYASYGVDVVYNVEIALSGSSVYQNAGSVTNLKEIDWTHKSLNDAVLNTGAAAGVESEFDVRVLATTTSAGGTIVFESDVVTIKVTPFVNNVTWFLIGDATAGDWGNSATNVNMYPILGNHAESTKYTYTGYFKVGGFKLVRDKGEWNPQYGAGSAVGTLSSDGGSGNINITTAGYYKVSFDLSNLAYFIESVNPPTVNYTTIGIIGNATSAGWDSDTDMTKSTFDSNVWYLENVTLTDGEMKFREGDDWAMSWGSTDENFGTASTSVGTNINVKAGVYDIYFNDSTGAFVLVKK